MLKISKKAFFFAKNLESVIIPSNVTTIGGDAFPNNKLINVTIPSSVTSIEAYAFDGNVNLNNIIMQGKTTTTGIYLGTSWNGTGTIVFAP